METLLSTRKAAAYAGIAYGHLRYAREHGFGPAVAKRGGCGPGGTCLYAPEEIDRWLAEQRRPPLPNTSNVLTTQDAAELMGVSSRWVMSLCKRGELAALTAGRAVKGQGATFDRAEVERYMALREALRAKPVPESAT